MPTIPSQEASSHFQTTKQPLLPTTLAAMGINNNQQFRTRPSTSRTYNQQFITGLYCTINKQQTWTLLIPTPSLFTFPHLHYHTVQGTQQPFIAGSYLSNQYLHEQQKISLPGLHSIPPYFSIIMVTLTDHFMNVLANQAKLFYSAHCTLLFETCTT